MFAVSGYVWLCLKAVLTTALLLCFSTISMSKADCDVEFCLACDDQSATCSINSSYNYVIPQNLNVTITNLTLLYQGDPKHNGTITKKSIEKYVKLKNVEIRGNIGSIEWNAFERLIDLENLTITRTLISQLPSALLPTNSSLRALHLRGNHLSEIPSHVFNQTLGLKTLDLSENCINITTCTLGAEFELLKVLERLVIERLTFRLCSRSFESVNKDLKVLEMAGSRISEFHLTAFSRFRSLEHLDISNVGDFALCPSKTSQLFAFLPDTLNSLTMRGWTNNEPDPNCYLTAEDMALLEGTERNLEKLDFYQSERAFGHSISVEFFEKLPGLKEINLAFCGITKIDHETFATHQSLQTLVLDGNPINIDDQNFSSTLKEISLVGVTVPSDHRVFAFANKVDLSANLLNECPLSDTPSNSGCKQQGNHYTTKDHFPNLQTLILNHNEIQSFFPQAEENSLSNLEICARFPNLTHLEVKHNHLADIRGLCSSLKVIRLSNNYIGEPYMGVLEYHLGLPNAEELDFSYNRLRNIPWNYFRDMPNLRVLDLSHNDLTKLPGNFNFTNNKKLEYLDLSWNELIYFDYRWIEELPNLQHLLLNKNLIPEFELKFFEAIENQKNESFVRQVNILHNPIICDCDHLYIREWVNKETPGVRLVGAKELRCSTQEHTVHDYDYDVTKCREMIALYVIVGILGVAGLTALIAWPCYKYKWYVEHPKIVFQALYNALRSAKFEHTVDYDAFLSYDHDSEIDIGYMIETLLPAVETSKDQVYSTVQVFRTLIIAQRVRLYNVIF